MAFTMDTVVNEAITIKTIDNTVKIMKVLYR